MTLMGFCRSIRPSLVNVVLALALAAGGFFLFSSVAQAQTGSEKTFAMMKDSRYLMRLYGAAMRTDAMLGDKCDMRDKYNLVRATVIIPRSPLKFEPGNPIPVAGAWHQRYWMTRCFGEKAFNAGFIAKPGEELRVIELVPGETFASQTLVRDVLMSVFTAAGLQKPIDCSTKDLHVYDTKPIELEELRKTLKPGEPLQNWKELWTVKACEAKIPVVVTFRSDGKGGTFFSAEVKGDDVTIGK